MCGVFAIKSEKYEKKELKKERQKERKTEGWMADKNNSSTVLILFL